MKIPILDPPSEPIIFRGQPNTTWQSRVVYSVTGHPTLKPLICCDMDETRSLGYRHLNGARAGCLDPDREQASEQQSTNSLNGVRRRLIARRRMTLIERGGT